MIKGSRQKERGVISGWMFAIIGLSIAFLGLGIFDIWAFVAYNEASTDLEAKLRAAVVDAKQEQAEEDEKKFTEREKEPRKTFKAPVDYCSLTFQYPKTWSEFWSEDTSNGGDFMAYLSTPYVPAIITDQQFALRVKIERKAFDDVLEDYEDLISSGKLKQSTSTSNGHGATRIAGNFNKNIRGEAAIYRCRDLTITVRTDADVHREEFQRILSSLDFND